MNYRSIIEVLLASVVFLFLDFFYLTSISGHFRELVKNIQKDEFSMKFLPTLITYVFLIYGLYYFVLREHKSPVDAAILGLVIYMVYEGTNLAIFKDWTWKTLFMDGLWGGVLYGATTFITYTLMRFVPK